MSFEAEELLHNPYEQQSTHRTLGECFMISFLQLL